MSLGMTDTLSRQRWYLFIRFVIDFQSAVVWSSTKLCIMENFLFCTFSRRASSLGQWLIFLRGTSLAQLVSALSQCNDPGVFHQIWSLWVEVQLMPWFGFWCNFGKYNKQTHLLSWVFSAIKGCNARSISARIFTSTLPMGSICVGGAYPLPVGFSETHEHLMWLLFKHTATKKSWSCAHGCQVQ